MAYLGKELNSPAKGHTMDFNQEITDIGGNYDPSAGVFTAPISGAYSFSLTVSVPHRSNGYSLHVDIVKNGQRFGYLFFDSNTVYWLKRTENIVLHLDHGDSVYTMVSASGGQFTVAAGVHSHLSGFLISAD